MCIIAAQPIGTNITKEILERCWNNNKDGGGFCYTDGSQVFTHKELKSFEKYWEAFQIALNLYPNSAFIHHFRISTHGKINETNCHPFHINKKLAFAHNGIINNSSYSKDFSDTYMFNEEVLKELPDGFLNKLVFHELIRAYIGYGSKLAFLDNESNINIINEKAGEWSEGIWYSNGGFKEYRYYDVGGKKQTYFPTALPSTTYQNFNKKRKDKKKGKEQASFKFKDGSVTGSSTVYDKYGQVILPSKRIYDLSDFATHEKCCDIDWEQRLKTDKKPEYDVLDAAFNKVESNKGLVGNCVVCDIELNSYREKSLGYCGRCEDKWGDNDGYAW
jgi:hypothetical protein